MQFPARLPFVLAFTGATLATSLGSAHVRWVYPPPRYAPVGNDDMNIKTGPCGRANDSRTTDMSRITTLDAGATIMVQFSETIDHPGFYRISFDNDGQDAFVAPTMRSQIQTAPPFTPPVLLDNIADRSGMGAKMYEAMITLPNTPCDRCTLQIIQVMVPASTMSWDPAPDQDIYYTCADIVLRAAGGTGGTGGTGGVSGSGGVPGGTGGAGGGIDQGGFGGAGGTGGGFGGMATGGALPTGGSGGAGVPTGGGGGTPATGGTATGGTPGGSPGAGAPAAGAAPASAPLEEPGCGCRTLPARSDGQALLVSALALLGLVVRRRRPPPGTSQRRESRSAAA